MLDNASAKPSKQSCSLQFCFILTHHSLWLGHSETKGDRQWGPVTDLVFENEGDVHI